MTFNHINAAEQLVLGSITTPLLADQSVTAAKLAPGAFTSSSLIVDTNVNFNEFQALEFRIENLTAFPLPGNPGRLIWRTDLKDLFVDISYNLNIISVNNIGLSIVSVPDSTHLIVNSTAGIDVGDIITQRTFSATVTNVFDAVTLVVDNSAGFVGQATAAVDFGLVSVLDSTHLLIDNSIAMSVGDTITQGLASTTITAITNTTHIIVASTAGFSSGIALVHAPFDIIAIPDLTHLTVSNVTGFGVGDVVSQGAASTTIVSIVDATHLQVVNTTGFLTNAAQDNTIVVDSTENLTTQMQLIQGINASQILFIGDATHLTVADSSLFIAGPAFAGFWLSVALGPFVSSLSSDGNSFIHGDVKLLSGTNITLPQVGQDITVNAFPAGATTQVQLNTGGVFAASPNLTFDGTTLTVDGSIAVGGITINQTNIDMGNTNPIINLPDPINPHDAVNKEYVDNIFVEDDTWDRDFINGYLFPHNLGFNVGIGTITPDAKLEVVGTTHLAGTLTVDNTLSVIGTSSLDNGVFTTDGAGGLHSTTVLGLYSNGVGGLPAIIIGPGNVNADNIAIVPAIGGTVQIQANGFGAGDASAILEVDSTTQGFLLPRMTSAQRDAIVSPATGLLIYNTDTSLFNVYIGTSWLPVGSPVGLVGDVQFNAGGGLFGSNPNFFWDNTNARLGIGNATPALTLDVSGPVAIRNVSNLAGHGDLTFYNDSPAETTIESRSTDGSTVFGNLLLASGGFELQSNSGNGSISVNTNGTIRTWNFNLDGSLNSPVSASIGYGNGVFAPAATLDVNGTGHYLGVLTVDADIFVGHSETSATVNFTTLGGAYNINARSTDGTMRFTASGEEVMRLDGNFGIAYIEAPLNMGGNQIHVVADPTAPQDAATKAYVDGGSHTVAGSNTQVQFNNNGVFGASSSLTWDGTTLSATGMTVTAGGDLVAPHTHTDTLTGATGDLTIEAFSDDITAVRVTKANGSTTVLDVDTLNARVGINNSAPTTSLDVTGSFHVSDVSEFNGNVTIDEEAGVASSLLITTITASTAGGITLTTAGAGIGQQGGSILLTCGDNPAGNHQTSGGDITLTSGNGGNISNGGDLMLTTGDSAAFGRCAGGDIVLSTGNCPTGGTNIGGNITLTSGNPGVGPGQSDVGGNILLTSFTPTNGGNLTLTGTGTANGTITAGGNMSIDGTTFHVDSVNHRVGVLTLTPAFPLDVNGEGNFNGNQIHTVADPTAPQDVATKHYVDGPSHTVAGSDTQIQFNNAGAFGASSNLTYDGSNVNLLGSVGLIITTNNGVPAQQGGSIVLSAGNSNGGDSRGGNLTLTSGLSNSSGPFGGSILLTTGFAFGGQVATGGSITLSTAGSFMSGSTIQTGIGGGITLTTGDCYAGTATGGNLTLTTGRSAGPGATAQGGSIILTTGPDNYLALPHSVNTGGNITLTAYNPALGGNITLTGTGATNGIITANKAVLTAVQVTTAPTAGYLLTSDASGNGTWQAPPVTIQFSTREIPSGAVDGVNTVFTLANTPTLGSEELYKNGMLQTVGGGFDYTISGATITFNVAPAVSSVIRVSYRY